MIEGDLEVWVFDWPARFLVEANEPDKALIDLFDDPTPYPYLVDITIPECACFDFQQNILNENGRTLCKHLIAAQRYRWLMGDNPKPLPTIYFEI